MGSVPLLMIGLKCRCVALPMRPKTGGLGVRARGQQSSHQEQVSRRDDAGGTQRGKVEHEGVYGGVRVYLATSFCQKEEIDWIRSETVPATTTSMKT